MILQVNDVLRKSLLDKMGLKKASDMHFGKIEAEVFLQGNRQYILQKQTKPTADMLNTLGDTEDIYRIIYIQPAGYSGKRFWIKDGS